MRVKQSFLQRKVIKIVMLQVTDVKVFPHTRVGGLWGKGIVDFQKGKLSATLPMTSDLKYLQIEYNYVFVIL